jgi:hypothetical protein
MNTNEIANSTKSNSPYRILMFAVPVLLASLFFLGSTTTNQKCTNCKSQKQKITRAFGLSEQNILIRSGKSGCQHEWQMPSANLE